jgi:tetratricopeptide (TPR) repeat protein
MKPAVIAKSKHRSTGLKLTLLITCSVLAACQSGVRPGGSSGQTIGSLLDRNAQNPERLLLEKVPPQKVEDIELESQRVEAAALSHYQSVLGMESAPGVRAEAMRRSADLRIEAAGHGLDINMEEVAIAAGLYQDLLAEFPDYPNNDHVVYQLARAYDLSGRSELAIDTLRSLASDYPASSRANDALFRSAEMLYLRKRYDEASEQYQKLISQDPDMPYWQMAQYKYAWSQYQLHHVDAAVTAFTGILTQLKMSSEVSSLDQLLALVAPTQAELVRDSLRGLTLALAAKPDGHKINEYFASLPGNQFYPLVYSRLGDLLLKKKRYTDAASVFDAFASAHPQHELAISHSENAISAYKQGGFTALMVAAQEAYVERYASDLLAGTGADTAPVKLTLLRGYMAEILGYRHAEAQQTAETDSDLRQRRFAAVAAQYRSILTMFPGDSEFATNSMRYADALYDGGELKLAAVEYARVAYDISGFDKPADAALASVKAYREFLDISPEAERATAQQAVITASTRLATTFPQHPERSRVLLASAEDLYGLTRYDEAIAICVPLLESGQWPESGLQRKALSITADAYFAMENFSQAEVYYSQLMPMLVAGSELRLIAADRLAVSVYRRAEAARVSGDHALAANLFMRAAELSSDAELKANASFDAAGQYYAVENWQKTTSVLHAFQKEFPRHAMATESDKLLAEAYQKSSRPGLAATVYSRIAKHSGNEFETRRQASVMAAKLYDQAGQLTQARAALESYISQFPEPLLEAQQFRLRLAKMAPANSSTHLRWLREIIAADNRAVTPLPASQLLAADASLQLAMRDVRNANNVELRLPIKSSLPRRQQAMEKAIDSLARAAGYGFADITTVAGHELGDLYRHFAAALMKSEKPRGLSGDVLEEYALLLEEQAYPFEEKAIDAFEANVARVKDGIWTAGMRKSLVALAELAPAKYGKQPQLENSYDSLN